MPNTKIILDFFNNKIIIEKHITSLDTIYSNIYERFKLQYSSYYLINLESNKIIRTIEAFNKSKNIEIIPRLRGGGLMKKIINPVIKFIFKIFDPIIKPLRGIAKAVLMLLKAIVYMSLLLIWIIKFMIWFLTDFVMSFPTDLLTLIKRIIYILFDTIFGIIITLFRKSVNKIGNLSLNAVAGWDNVPDDEKDKKESKFLNNECNNKKCYRTTEGTVPFSVIIATILCPPIGVFMEYGITGWFNILICGLLTLAFYFPGLIYGLILLYC